MAYTVIQLPEVNHHSDKWSWSRTDLESMEIVGGTDTSTQVVLLISNGNPSESGITYPFFKIIFNSVLEYRFIDSSFDYEDIAAHKSDFAFGLIEIHSSAYIENMASKGTRGDLPKGQRFGRYSEVPDSGGIAESEVRHFRFDLDDWGRLDVICLGVSMEPLQERSPGSTS